MKKGIYPISEITHDAIQEIRDWIITNMDKRKKFTILINSSGGSPSSVIRFSSFTSVLPKNVELIGVAVDTCGSAALALLQCCRKRIAVKNTSFFIHHVKSDIRVGYYYKNRDQIISDELESNKKIEDEIVSIQCKRSGLSEKKWMEIADNGEKYCYTPIFTEQCLKLGLVDKTIDSYSIF